MAEVVDDLGERLARHSGRLGEASASRSAIGATAQSADTDFTGRNKRLPARRPGSLHEPSCAGGRAAHVAVANKVQTRSGKWLSTYGKVAEEYKGLDVLGRVKQPVREVVIPVMGLANLS